MRYTRMYFRSLSGVMTSLRLVSDVKADAMTGEIVIPVRLARSSRSLPNAWDDVPVQHQKDSPEKIARLERRRIARKTAMLYE